MPRKSLDDPTKIKVFKYETPTGDRPKQIVWLGRTDRLFAAVQTIAKGGENNLHSHAHLDGLWFVLRGRARFYSDHHTVAAELGPREGVLIPRGVKYWFESIGAEPLEVMQIECSDVAFGESIDDRLDYAPQKDSIKTSVHTEAKPG